METKSFSEIIKKISLSITRPEDLLTIKLINPAKCWLKLKSPKLEMDSNNRINCKLLIL